MSGGFQSSVSTQPAVGVAGDFCSANPRYAVDAGPGGLVAGAAGLTVGRFAWLSTSQVDFDGAPAIANSFGSGLPAGIVPRLQQGLITIYLADASMVVPPGFGVSIMSAADMWVVNSNASAQAVPGNKAYANFTTGLVTFAASGAPTTASATTSSIAAGTAATFTGSIAGNVLTASSVTNTIYVGAVLTGGSGLVAGTYITSQLSGTPGGAGTYSVSVAEQTVASASLTATPYVLDTTGGTVTGTVAIGSVITSAGGTATGVVVGNSVQSVYASTAGKWVMNGSGTVTSGTIVLESNIETSWTCQSTGLAGELVKITRLP